MGNTQPRKHARGAWCDLPAFARMGAASGPFDQLHIFLQAERDGPSSTSCGIERHERCCRGHSGARVPPSKFLRGRLAGRRSATACLPLASRCPGGVTSRCKAQALLDAGEVAGLRCAAESCANGVEVHVNHGGQQAPLVEERLASESPLPEATGALVLGIGAARDRLVQHPHEPGQVCQSASVPRRQLGDLVPLRSRKLAAAQVSLHHFGPPKEAAPAAQDLIVAPSRRALRIDVHDDVVMIAHHRIGGDVDGERGGKSLEPLGNPSPPVFETFARRAIDAAKASAPDTSAHAVVPLRIGEADECGTWTRHAARMQHAVPS